MRKAHRDHRSRNGREPMSFLHKGFHTPSAAGADDRRRVHERRWRRKGSGVGTSVKRSAICVPARALPLRAPGRLPEPYVTAPDLRKLAATTGVRNLSR